MTAGAVCSTFAAWPLGSSCLRGGVQMPHFRFLAAHAASQPGLARSLLLLSLLARWPSSAPLLRPLRQVIAIDEAQFFTDLVEFCASAADEVGRGMYCSSTGAA